MTSPISRASDAETERPVRRSSRARARPMILGSLWEPPSHGMYPSAKHEKPNVDPSAANRRSQARASSKPWFHARPWMAAMVGALRLATWVATRRRWRTDSRSPTGASFGHGLISSCQKFSPLLVRTAALRFASSFRNWQTLSSCSAGVGFRRMSSSDRTRRMTATAP